jgi:DNA-binding MarR family transcriptional regulator
MVSMNVWDILLFLVNNPKFDTVAKISNIRYLAKSYVITSLKSLEKSGYIVKSSEESDKRKIYLCLTEKANAIVAEGRKKQYDSC